MLPTTMINQIAEQSKQNPHAIALIGEHVEVSYEQLMTDIQTKPFTIDLDQATVISLAMDNSPAWALLDLMALSLNLPHVPLPLFFSSQQIVHAIQDAGVDCVVTDQLDQYQSIFNESNIKVKSHQVVEIYGKQCHLLWLVASKSESLMKGVVKITYTSGTTGTPKGVCLNELSITNVAMSLLNETRACSNDRHISLLPLSTLLENIGGLYVPLMAGATCIFPSMTSTGLLGASGFNAQKMLNVLNHWQASTLILTPELLLGLVIALEQGALMPESLRFIAVGGASVSPSLLERADRLGLPVYEGYGLSECASVVALNTMTAKKLGSVGKPLPHLKVQIAEDGEILVSGNRFLTYTKQTPLNESIPWSTGDIGHLDEEGYIYVTGRKKNIFITSFGRNVSPEWVERELTVHPVIAQAALFGEARPFNVAVIVARGSKEQASTLINSAIAEVNLSLPDYARISKWILADHPFSFNNGLATSNGRLRRYEIFKHYQHFIQDLYKEN
jgi:long-subunit acyl-CoA synthetase (AMP-forming)